MKKDILKSIIMGAALLTAGGAQAQTLTAEDVTLVAGQQAELVVGLEADEPMAAVNFRLYLPEGVDLVWDDDEESYVGEPSTDLATTKYTLSLSNASDGSKLAVIYPPTSRSFKKASGELLRITLAADASLAGRELTGQLKKIGVSDQQAVSRNQGNIPDVEFAIHVSVPTGISTATSGGAQAEAYNLQGQRVSAKTKGIYIVDGTKVVVK